MRDVPMEAWCPVRPLLGSPPGRNPIDRILRLLLRMAGSMGSRYCMYWMLYTVFCNAPFRLVSPGEIDPVADGATSQPPMQIVEEEVQGLRHIGEGIVAGDMRRDDEPRRIPERGIRRRRLGLG